MTFHRTVPLTALAIGILASAAVAQGDAAASSRKAPSAAKIDSVEALVASIAERERAVSSVELRMKTRGSFPGEGRFETEGTLRVLGTTHFHTSMTARFGEEITTEFETVKTPKGVWMRESDPAQGEVFVRMEQSLLDRIEAASLTLGGEAFVGPGADMANGPLGSVMLGDLNKQFDLKLSGPKLVGKHECWTVGGAIRDEADGELFGPVDRVELLVRRADRAVVRMTQLARGDVMTDVQITDLKLDMLVDKESFRIDVPRGAKVLDVMEHPPARAQIERIFSEARAKGWSEDGGDASAPKAAEAAEGEAKEGK